MSIHWARGRFWVLVVSALAWDVGDPGSSPYSAKFSNSILNLRSYSPLKHAHIPIKYQF